jgi:cellulose synthase/poly-beta-1,6-N-acetylglucosamine synthase-like glycosyltransferase
MSGLIIVAVILYGLVLSALFIYGLNFFYHSYLAMKHRSPDPEPLPMDNYPRVTVQIPIYNERYVARRAIEAIVALEWPHDRLQIQVLDDSNDDTFEIVAESVQRYRVQGLDIHHLHRTNRIGYKAGALAEGMREATGEFVAIFDADFFPDPDFLHRTLPHFNQPEVGFVQTRWGHLNEQYSFFTKLQALAIDGHFMVEQYARSREGFLLNFNGTAGVWRAATIEGAGGWEFDTLTEDLDLSYRAQLAGWRGVYLRDTVTPGELPVTVNGFRRQQYRWARGSIESAKKLLPRVLRSDLDLRIKVQSILHMTGYGIHLLMFALALMYPLIAVLSQGRPFVLTLYGLAGIFNLTALAPTTYFTVGQHELNRPIWRRLPSILFLSVAGSGMMVNSVRGIVDAFSKREAVFERTPKFASVGDRIAGSLRTYQVKANFQILLEVSMLLFNLNTVRLAWNNGLYFTLFYSAIFSAGLLYLLGMTAWGRWKILLERPKSELSPPSRLDERRDWA